MIHGVINIHKEKGFTSHDVVAKLRGIIGQKKIGHTGTLDPDATGVLPVCLGKATKLCDMLTDKNKTYCTVLLLGKTTDTQDISGEVLSESSWAELTEDQVLECVESFVGDYNQIPPMYSALKVNGKKLYELAREGIEIERKARPVTIYHIEVEEVNLPYVTMEVSCSKGTYIRTLCHDIGQKLGCGACMQELTRTKVSRFELAHSFTLEQVRGIKDAGKLDEIVVPIDAMFEEYEAVTMQEEYASLVYNGNPFMPKHIVEQKWWEDQTPVRVYDHKGRFLAVYKYEKDKGSFRIQKMFFDKEEM